MGKLTASLYQRFVNWDRPSQIGFTLAVLLLGLLMFAAITGSEEVRHPALIGAMGLLITMQVIFLWANRGMVADYTKAQRAYLNEDFEAACAILEAYRHNGKIDFRALTLLGNTYRQMGKLQESEAVLLDAIDMAPKHPFPVYGIGRTFIAQGRYPEAAGALQQALDDGGPEVIRFDAGEAHYRLGNKRRAIELLREARESVQHESHRALMTDYLLHRLDAGDLPSPELIKAGLPYWERQSGVFQTPYGEALAADIAEIQALASHQG